MHVPRLLILKTGLLVAGVPCFACCCLPTNAADVSWINSDGGVFSDSANWDPAQVPSADDSAIFNLDAGPLGYEMTLVGDELNDQLVVRDVVSIDLGGYTYSLDSDELPHISSAVEVGVLPGDAADLSISGGTLNSSSSAIGKHTGASGVVTVNGTDAAWDTGSLYVGYFGNGTLNIFDAQAVSHGDYVYIGNGDDSMGVVNVDGPDATWTSTASGFSIGRSGYGRLNITGGGAVFRNDDSFGADIGFGTESTGEVIVDGTGSSWDVRFLNVGFLGNGSLTIDDGGLVSGLAATIGNGGSSIGIGTVDGAGSMWTLDRDLSVGDFGHGTLSIANGGQVNANSALWIGNFKSDELDVEGIGVVTVDGLGSTLDSYQIAVGHRSSGTLNISNGGLVTSTNGFIGHESNSTGFVTVSGAGSRWVNSNGLFVGGDYSGAHGRGTLELNGGTVETPSRALGIYHTGLLRGIGTIAGDVTNSGSIAPGFSPGIIEIQGDYTQDATGVLEIEIAGTDNSDPANPQFDQLIVSGTATLGGTSEFIIIDEYNPQPNDEVAYLTAANVVGEFDALLAPNLAQVNPNLGFQVFYNSNDVRLRFRAIGEILFTGEGADATDWNQTQNWDLDEVPENFHRVDLSRNQTGNITRVEVKNGDAHTYDFAISDPSLPIELAVTGGHTLSAAVGGITIGDNATVELNNGNLATPQTVRVTGSGKLSGNGQVFGNLVAESKISPGTSADPTGNLNVVGDYQQSSTGMLEIGLQGTVTDEFDTLTISGEAALDGMLMVDVSQLGAIQIGTAVEILTAEGGIASGSQFNEYRVLGFSPASDDVWIDVVYFENGVALGGVDVYDVNNDQILDAGDVTAFALAVIDSQDFEDQYYYNPADRLDFSASDSIDFDDIAQFRANHPYAGGQAIPAAIELLLAARAVPEPSAERLALIVVGVLITVRRHDRNSLITHLTA